ncbi:MAG TPA: F0F1 ATP synthase subunit B [Candidatus Paceibacterota bacterium]
MSDLFSAFGVKWELLLIQAVNFGLLLTALTYFLYKPILKIIDERREKIAESVRVAEAAQRRLEEAKEKGDKMVGDAAKHAESLVASARMKAETTGSEMMKEAQARADQMMVEARARAEEERRKAMMESEREITRAAMLAAEKIMLARSEASGGGGREKAA